MQNECIFLSLLWGQFNTYYIWLVKIYDLYDSIKKMEKGEEKTEKTMIKVIEEKIKLFYDKKPDYYVGRIRC